MLVPEIALTLSRNSVRTRDSQVSIASDSNWLERAPYLVLHQVVIDQVIFEFEAMCTFRLTRLLLLPRSSQPLQSQWVSAWLKACAESGCCWHLVCNVLVPLNVRSNVSAATAPYRQNRAAACAKWWTSHCSCHGLACFVRLLLRFAHASARFAHHA